MGLGICFDFRFLSWPDSGSLGAKILLVPAANMTTGPAPGSCCSVSAPWTPSASPWARPPVMKPRLLRGARGHSIVCDPWGAVLHLRSREEARRHRAGPVPCGRRVRRQLPLLSARRPDVYTLRPTQHETPTAPAGAERLASLCEGGVKPKVLAEGETLTRRTLVARP